MVHAARKPSQKSSKIKTSLSLSNAVKGNSAAATSKSTNPFRVPGDDEIFSKIEENKSLRRQNRQEWNKLPIWKKHRVMRADDPRSRLAVMRRSLSQKIESATPPAVPIGERQREKENMTDFVKKKRDMFLVQLSLDTKREEIRKLEEKARAKDVALKKSEQMLEEDAKRFDEFLRLNDKRAHAAMKQHEKESRERQEKAHQVKVLSSQVAKLASKAVKYQEMTAECKRFKEFLTHHTPDDWIDKHQTGDTNKSKEASPADSVDESGNATNSDASAKVMKQEKEGETAEIPSSAVITDDDENIPLYFEDPEQLMEQFVALEERNLFTLQNIQENEEHNEDLMHQIEDYRHESAVEIKKLNDTISTLHEKVSAEERRQESILAMNVMSDDGQQSLLHGIGVKVAELYKRAGFDTGGAPSTVQRLRFIEHRLRDVLQSLGERLRSEVSQAERRLEAERRERVRHAKKQKAELAAEIRKAQAARRAITENTTVTGGRRLMQRSAPKRSKKKKSQRDGDANAAAGESERNERKFFVK